MQILLACAKIMNEKCRTISLPISEPRFEKEAEDFIRDLWQYDQKTLMGMFKCSADIAAQNKIRYARFFDEDNPTLPAILAYHGQAYKHLKAETLSDEDLDYAHSHLWITSFLYGLLRPLDGIHPYRLAGEIKLPSAGGLTLFDFWKSRLTDMLIDTVKADDGILIHLATEEFQHLFDWKRVCKELHVVQPLFYVRQKGGLKVQAVWAKTCRGAMTRYIIQNRLKRPEEMQGFSYEGFEYNPHLGEPNFPHFVRE